MTDYSIFSDEQLSAARDRWLKTFDELARMGMLSQAAASRKTADDISAELVSRAVKKLNPA